MKLLISILVATTFSLVSARTNCTHDTQCGKNECCYYHTGPLVVSRRQADLISLTDMHQGGWCEPYQPQGASCSVFAKINGHCSCAPNLKCQFEPLPTIHFEPIIPTAVLLPTAILLPIGQRRSMVYQGPGSYKCLP